MTTLLVLLVAAIVVLFAVKDLRMTFVTQPAFALFKRVLPTLSATERDAMEAGDVWWEGELFRGNPDWEKLHGYGKPLLSAEEQDFLDNQVMTALAMINDFDIVQERRDLPPELWDYFKKEGFFALIIPKKYGGLGFSAFANSSIVATLASRSISAAVTVMVPNSLGPGELLCHYGTQEQKDRWLPRLARGDEIPCFALTGPEAGSDAGGIPDIGVVTKGQFDGEETLGIELCWDKRYITLAPVATVLGLAFRMSDPHGLLGECEDIGITCALIPTNHPGVEIGHRHDPLGMAFMNGTTSGDKVFIPIDWIIGGADYAGKGWRMLVECLAAGRGISLPALAAASGHMVTKTSTAYAYVRKQFGLAIGQFEGVQEALARIIGNTYQLEAARRLTTIGIDMKLRPAVVTAIAKYHMTEMGRTVINDAMDIQAGKGIQLGPKNYLGHAYMANPISITVEGANILTRSLMIFGQGAIRCHPFVLAEMETAVMEDEDEALECFDGLLRGHLKYAAGNALTSLLHGLTGSIFAKSPVSGETTRYYKQLGRLSASLAIVTDVTMLLLGGQLKRREMLSGRLGDLLSELYLGSATLKLFEDNGRQHDDLSLVHYVMKTRTMKAAKALEDTLRNFPLRPVGWLLRLLVFPFGNHFNGPSDRLSAEVATALMKPCPARSRLTFLCPSFDSDTGGIAEVEEAFLNQFECQEVYKRIYQAQKAGDFEGKGLSSEILAQALADGIISSEEGVVLQKADELRRAAIAVDKFNSL